MESQENYKRSRTGYSSNDIQPQNDDGHQKPKPSDFYDDRDPRGMSTSEHNDYMRAWESYESKQKRNEDYKNN